MLEEKPPLAFKSPLFDLKFELMFQKFVLEELRYTVSNTCTKYLQVVILHGNKVSFTKGVRASVKSRLPFIYCVLVYSFRL